MGNSTSSSGTSAEDGFKLRGTAYPVLRLVNGAFVGGVKHHAGMYDRHLGPLLGVLSEDVRNGSIPLAEMLGEEAAAMVVEAVDGGGRRPFTLRVDARPQRCSDDSISDSVNSSRINSVPLVLVGRVESGDGCSCGAPTWTLTLLTEREALQEKSLERISGQSTGSNSSTSSSECKKKEAAAAALRAAPLVFQCTGCRRGSTDGMRYEAMPDLVAALRRAGACVMHRVAAAKCRACRAAAKDATASALDQKMESASSECPTPLTPSARHHQHRQPLPTPVHHHTRTATGDAWSGSSQQSLQSGARPAAAVTTPADPFVTVCSSSRDSASLESSGDATPWDTAQGMHTPHAEPQPAEILPPGNFSLGGHPSPLAVARRAPVDGDSAAEATGCEASPVYLRSQARPLSNKGAASPPSPAASVSSRHVDAMNSATAHRRAGPTSGSERGAEAPPVLLIAIADAAAAGRFEQAAKSLGVRAFVVPHKEVLAVASACTHLVVDVMGGGVNGLDLMRKARSHPAVGFRGRIMAVAASDGFSGAAIESGAADCFLPRSVAAVQLRVSLSDFVFGR